MAVCAAALLAGALAAPAAGQEVGAMPPLIGPSVPGPSVPADNKFRLVAYGDTRFTNPANTTDTNPRVRQFLVKQVAEQRPVALLLTGDLPFVGADATDWQRYRDETAVWRTEGIALFSTIGNHEVRGGYDKGKTNYLENFAPVKGYLYYSVRIGNVYVISLDETQSTKAGSEQRSWLASQLEHLPKGVDFVFLLDHMPLMADVQSQMVASLPAPPEVALRDFLEAEAEHSSAKFMVISGHIHSYERFEHGGISYIISGGGGATPYYVMLPGNEDLYKGTGLINYNYVVIDVDGKTARAEMYRVKDPAAAVLTVEPRDSFTLEAPAPKTGAPESK